MPVRRAFPYQHHEMGTTLDRLLNTIENESGFPPCLVFERGNDSLTSRLASKQATVAEQRTILYAVPRRISLTGCVSLMTNLHIVFLDS